MVRNRNVLLFKVIGILDKEWGKGLTKKYLLVSTGGFLVSDRRIKGRN